MAKLAPTHRAHQTSARAMSLRHYFLQPAAGTMQRCWLNNATLPVSLFCAGFVLVSAGLCRFRCFVLVLCWSLLVSAGFAVLCWFCAGLCWSLPVSLFCAGFVLVSAGLCRLGLGNPTWEIQLGVHLPIMQHRAFAPLPAALKSAKERTDCPAF